MGGGTRTTEFWLDLALDRTRFIEEFETQFPGGRAEHIPVVPDAVFFCILFHLHVPVGREEELAPFLARYVETHNPANMWSRAS
ncbi:MAG: hypothetical protein Q7R67_02350 [bacterium]|nr:hypothetical protein [bacterium]